MPAPAKKNQPVQPPAGGSKTMVAVLIYVALALTTFLVYLPTLHHDFVNYDDFDYVTQNPYVQSGLSAKALAWVWGSDVARNWHPITMLSHMLDCQLYGMKAGGHHLTSLVLHVANTLLLFLLLRKMTGATWRSAAVAGLFALHPLRVESVAWVAERKDVLSTFFWLLTIWAYIRYVEKPKIIYYLAALVFFAFGLMSKPMLVTLPFTLLLLDYWPLKRIKSKVQSPKSKATGNSIGWLLAEKIPFFILSAASCVVTYWIQQRGGAVWGGATLPLATRLGNAVISYARYIGKMFWPQNLAPLYMRADPWAGWQVGMGALFVVVITGLVIWQARRRSYLAVGWFWYLGTLVPVIGLVQVGMQTMADRYTYVPLIGIFIMLIWGAADLAPRWLAGAVTGVALAGCIVLTYMQVGWWKDSETLFRHMIAVTPGNFIAHYNLGNYYSSQDKLEAAAAEYKTAVTTNPSYADAFANLGLVRLKQRRFDEAVTEYKEAVRISPQYLFIFNLANTLADAGRLAEAIPYYQQALGLNANAPDAHNNYGMTLEAQGKGGEAIAEYRLALQLKPDHEGAEHNLANALVNANQLEEAKVHYQHAIQLDPKHVENFNGLGICYAMTTNFAAAEQQFKRMAELQPQNSSAFSNIGNAQAEQGRLDDAIASYEKAIVLNPKDYQAHFNLGLCQMRRGQRAEAQAHLEEALRLHPDYPGAQKALEELRQQAVTTPR